MDLGPQSLTITVGFGPSLFDQRFGLAGRMPAGLLPFGAIPGDDKMDPANSGGDLCIQACADDPLVVLHAIRNMVRAARGSAVLRWSQLGFAQASSTGAGTVDAAQPDGLQGRHEQHPRRRRACPGRARLGAAAGHWRHRYVLDDQWQLSGGAENPDGPRALGRRIADRSGAGLRPEEAVRRPAVRRRGIQPDGLCEDR